MMITMFVIGIILVLGIVLTNDIDNRHDRF